MIKSKVVTCMTELTEDRVEIALETVRAELQEQLAVLRQPGVGAKLRELFAATPQEIADAVNAAPDDEA